MPSGMAAPRCPGARCQRDGGRPDGRHRRSRVRRGHGGGVEDVLGNSAFDPRRFAGSWAVARGVTAPPVVPTSPCRRWPALALGTVGGAALLALAGGVLVGG